jgi:hypothetical protein
MGWAEIYDFMKARDPQFEDSLVGVPREDIALCEEGLGITLPHPYVEFLAAMGVDSGRYILYGYSFEHDFYDLVEQLPPEDYPPHDFFKIAREQVERTAGMYDLFLHLRPGGLDDAPLVLFEDGSELQPDAIIDVGRTFLEELSSGAWEIFDARARSFNRIVNIGARGADEIAIARARALALLGRYQLAPSLPPLHRIDCLGLGDLCARIEQIPKYSIVEVTVAGSDRKQLDQIVELFLDNVPGARVDPRARSLPGTDDDGR